MAPRPILTVLAGVVAGGLVDLSMPPSGWWPLGWLGLATLAAVLPGLGWKTRAVVGAAFGLADFLPGLWWVQEFSVAGYVAVVVISALYYTAAVALVPAARRRWIVVSFAPLIILAEAGRDRFPVGGLPLGGIPIGQAGGPLVPVMRLGGSLLLAGETALAGVALASLYWVAVSLRAAPVPGRWAIAGTAAAVLVAGVIPVAGLLSPSGAGSRLGEIRVALVQGGGPRGTRAVDTDPSVVFDRHLAASASLEPPLDLVIWPEGVLQSQTPFQESTDASIIAGLAVRLGATVLVGIDQDVGPHRYRNEVAAWSPQGDIGAVYVKNHLVPFGEYVPYRSFFEKFFDLTDVPYDGIPGRGPGFINTPAGPLAIMISYEVFFDERARGGVRAGGQILVVPTNTASYRSDQVPAQEVAADRLRAWETGRWLVQVTPTGYSDVVSPTGGVVRSSRLDARQIIEASVPRRNGLTVYDRTGDLPVIVAAAAAWLAASAGRRLTVPGGWVRIRSLWLGADR